MVSRFKREARWSSSFKSAPPHERPTAPYPPGQGVLRRPRRQRWRQNPPPCLSLEATVEAGSDLLIFVGNVLRNGNIGRGAPARLAAQLGRAEGAEESRRCTRTTSTWKTHDIVLVASHRGVRTPSRPRGVGPHRPGLASEHRVFDDDDDDDDEDGENVLGLQLSPRGPGTGPGCRPRWIPAVRGHPGVLRFRDQGFG